MLGLPPEIIVGMIAALSGGLLTEVFRWMVTHRSQKIDDAKGLLESASSVVKSYDQLVEDLREQIKSQQQEIEGLQAQQIQARADICILQDENERLARQIEALHLDYQNLAEKYQDCAERLKMALENHEKEQHGGPTEASPVKLD